MRKWILFMLFVIPTLVLGKTVATDLFFSEYIEGSSNNKALEIFNGTGQDVDLGIYMVLRYNNGSATPSDTLELSGTLNNNDVYVIANPSADPPIMNVADITSTITFYNGDDAIALVKNGTIIDVIGVIGEDPGSAWSVADVSDGTAEHTLVRKNTIIQGQTDWALSAGTNADDSEWLVYPQNEFSYLGSHVFGSGVDLPPMISNITPSAKIPDADEDLVITATITDDNAVAVAEIHFIVDNGVNNAVAMTHTGGDTYEGTIASTFYENGQVLDWWIYVEDDGANITESQHNVIRVGTMNIADLHQVDADGVSIYEGELVRVQGVVTVEDSVFSTSNFDGYIQDATGGINVFMYRYFYYGGELDFPENGEYIVIGQITTYRGKVEVVPESVDDIQFVGTASPVMPEEVTLAQILSDPEGYEGKLVVVKNVSKISGTWAGGQNLTVSDDGTTTITLRIEGTTDLDENTEPAWPQDVTAIVGQYASSTPPFDGGYQILPRRYTDFSTPQGQDEFPVINTNSIPFDAFEPGVQTITAEVTDDNQVSSVELYYYFIINDTWPTLPTDTVSVSMSLTTGDTYSADVDLSSLSNGDGFVYWVEATDNVGQKTETNPFEVLVGTSPLGKAHVLGQSGLAYDGFYGKFTGVITAEPGLFSSSYFFMQDATGGVELYRSGGFDENYLNGDSLLVTGYIGEFNSLSQLENYTITLLKSGATVTPPEITTADVGEMYEGMLVTIPDLDTLAGQSTEWVTTGSSFNLDMGDEEGNIVVRIATDTLKNSPEPQWPSTITGVLTLYQGTYQLQPRYPSDISTLLSVGDKDQVVETFEVFQNYPNPFNPSTIVAFNLPENGQVSLKVFNIMGQVVKAMDLKGKIGRNEITVDFSSLSTGIYFYQIQFKSNVITKKMMFIK